MEWSMLRGQLEIALIEDCVVDPKDDANGSDRESTTSVNIGFRIRLSRRKEVKQFHHLMYWYKVLTSEINSKELFFSLQTICTFSMACDVGFSSSLFRLFLTFCNSSKLCRSTNNSPTKDSELEGGGGAPQKFSDFSD